MMMNNNNTTTGSTNNNNNRDGNNLFDSGTSDELGDLSFAVSDKQMELDLNRVVKITNTMTMSPRSNDEPQSPPSIINSRGFHDSAHATKSLLVNASDALRKLQTELESERRLRSSAEDELLTLRKDMLDIRNNERELELRCRDLENEYRTLKDERPLLLQKIEEARAVNAHQSSQLQRTQHDLMAKNEECQKLQAQIATMTQSLSGASSRDNDEQQALRDKLDARNAECQELRSKMNHMEQQQKQVSNVLANNTNEEASPLTAIMTVDMREKLDRTNDRVLKLAQLVHRASLQNHRLHQHLMAVTSSSSASAQTHCDHHHRCRERRKSRRKKRKEHVDETTKLGGARTKRNEGGAPRVNNTDHRVVVDIRRAFDEESPTRREGDAVDEWHAQLLSRMEHVIHTMSKQLNDGDPELSGG